MTDLSCALRRDQQVAGFKLELEEESFHLSKDGKKLDSFPRKETVANIWHRVDQIMGYSANCIETV